MKLITCFPTSFNFGNVNVNDIQSIPLELTNSGDETVTITNISMSDDVNFVIENTNQEISIGETITMNVSVIPTIDSAITCDFEFFDDTSSVGNFNSSAIGVEVGVSLPLLFSDTEINTTNHLSFVISNDSNYELVIKYIYVTETTKSFKFKIQDGAFLSHIVDLVVPPLSEQTVSCRFAPKSVGNFIRKIRLTFLNQTSTYMLSGKSYDSSYRGDSFSVEFDRVIESAEISVYDQHGEKIAGQGEIDTVNNKLYYFKPNKVLVDDSSYRVVVHKQNTTGKHDESLRESYEWSFSTGKEVRPFVISTSPFDDQVSVNVNSSIIITFNEMMNHNSISISVMNDNSIVVPGQIIPINSIIGIDSPIGSIVPSKKGEFYWDSILNDLYYGFDRHVDGWIICDMNYGLTSYKFMPDSSLSNMENFHVSIDKSTSSIRTSTEFPLGIPLSTDYTFNFRTINIP